MWLNLAGEVTVFGTAETEIRKAFIARAGRLLETAPDARGRQAWGSGQGWSLPEWAVSGVRCQEGIGGSLAHAQKEGRAKD